jgi:glycosyltransferase involved in cell wall biosynthesis
VIVVPKVMHLVISLAHGGLERLVVEWTNERNRRYQGSTCICCLNEPGEIAGQVEGSAVFSVNAIRSRFPWDASAVRRLKKHLLGKAESGKREEHSASGREGSDLSGFRFQVSSVSLPSSTVLHAHNLAAWQYAVLAALGTGIRVVYTQHGPNLHNAGVINQLRCRLLSLRTEQIVAVSDSTREIMVAEYRIPRRRILTIANGIRIHPDRSSEAAAANRAEIRGRYGIPADALVMGSVGRLALVKGYDRLLPAFAEIVRLSERPVFLLFIGDGDERGRLEQMADRAGVRNRLVLAGYQANPWLFYDAMDLFCLPSRSEGLSIALLEAMSSGIPVAVTDVGANRDVIENGECGILLPDDETAWADVIRRQPPLSGDCGVPRMTEDGQRTERARTRVRERYSLEQTLNEYEAIYRQLCEV